MPANGDSDERLKRIMKRVRRIELITRGMVKSPAEQEIVARALESSPRLATLYRMREELARTWERSTLSTEQLVAQLRDWCDRAEASGIETLAEFSQRLRRYAAA